jgi:uncharacterized membrane protein YhaH (DUF805 family)
MGEPVLILAFVVIVIGGIGSIKGRADRGPDWSALTDTLGRFLLPEASEGGMMEASAAAIGVGSALASMLIYALMAVVLIFKPKRVVFRPMRDARVTVNVATLVALILAGGSRLIAQFADEPFLVTLASRATIFAIAAVSASTLRWGLAGSSRSAMRRSLVSAAMRRGILASHHADLRADLMTGAVPDRTARNQMLVLWLVAHHRQRACGAGDRGR